MSKSKEKQLVASTYSLDTEEFKSALNMDPDVNKAFDRDEPLLISLVSSNRIDLVKILLNHIPKNHLLHKCNVNVRDENHRVALTSAVYLSNLEMVQLLIEHGADINARDSTGYAPIHAAVEIEHIKIAELLLKNGANPNVIWKQDLLNFQENVTPLHRASSHRNIPMITLLISYGADQALKMKNMHTGALLNAKEIFVSDSNRNPHNTAELFNKAVVDGLVLRDNLFIKSDKRSLTDPVSRVDKRQKADLIEANDKPDSILTKDTSSFVEKVQLNSSLTEDKVLFAKKTEQNFHQSKATNRDQICKSTNNNKAPGKR